MSDNADLNEFARLFGDFVLFLTVRYPPRILRDGSRVAYVDLVVDAVCEAEVVVFCLKQVYVFLDEVSESAFPSGLVESA